LRLDFKIQRFDSKVTFKRFFKIDGIVQFSKTVEDLILLGSAVAVMSTRFLESLLFGVSALAPWAFIAPAMALLVAAALAALIPAARAGSLPPADVLRSE